MRARHLGHRGEIRCGVDGLGRYFLAHGHGFDLKSDEVFEEKVMKNFHLTIIASVGANRPWTPTRLDELEGRLQKQLMAMYYNGGINLRDKTQSRLRQGH